MKQTISNIFIFVGSVLIGGFLNVMVIKYSSLVIPPPSGFNLTTEEGLKAAMAVMEPKHFILPFVAHSLGSFVAAFLIGLFTKEKKIVRSLLAGFLFFLGGAYMVFILPSPLWFDAVDLSLAYMPMAWLGYKLALRFSK